MFIKKEKGKVYSICLKRLFPRSKSSILAFNKKVSGIWKSLFLFNLSSFRESNWGKESNDRIELSDNESFFKLVKCFIPSITSMLLWDKTNANWKA